MFECEMPLILDRPKHVGNVNIALTGNRLWDLMDGLGEFIEEA